MSDLLIRGGTVVDGTGAPGFEADVRVRDGRIAEVGPSLPGDGEDVLDAGGALVTPGFIDIHTHFDPSLFWDPFADPMPQHGVTSVLIGNCSLSLVPVREGLHEAFADLFAYIEDIPQGAFGTAVPWTLSSFADYRGQLERDGLGVNVAAMVGHAALRMYVMGERAWDSVATDDERAQMAALLDQCMREGAFGFSTSFFDEDQMGRPVPSRVADDAELEALFDVLAARNGLLEFIPNLTGKEIKDDIRRIADLTTPRGVVSTWNVINHDPLYPYRCQRMLDQAAELQAEGVPMWPQVTPRTFDFRVNWDRSMSFMMMPEGWHRIVQAQGEEMRGLLESEEWRAAARAEWDVTKTGMFPAWQIHKVRLVSVARPELERWLGRTLADLHAARGGHPSDVLADWMLENDCAAGIVNVGVTNGDPDGVAMLLNSPQCVVGASDAGAHLEMQCAAGDTTLLLTRHVRERGDMTLSHAIWQLTGRVAGLFGFAGRGRIAPGLLGDLAVFDLDELVWGEEVYVKDVPGGGGRLRRPEGGYRYTVAGGVVTQVGGTLTGARPGAFIPARP